MKKFTFLLSLLFAFVGVTASAQSLTISDAPNSDGTWASNTQWYLIRVALTDGYHPKKAYLSTNENYVNTNGLLLTNETVPTDDKGLWCIVGDKTNGYKFYNKSEGTTKVLGVSDWSKMYETSSTGSVAMSFDIANSTADSKAHCVKFHDKSDGDYWWNNSDNGGCHLSYWKDQKNSTVATTGNAYYFIPVNDLTSATYDAKLFLGNTNVEAFRHIPGVSEACANEISTWDANKTQKNDEAFTTKATNYLNNAYYRVTNCNTDRAKPVLAADASSVACVAAAEKMTNASTLWKFVPTFNEGTEKAGVKLYNVNAKAYLGALVAPSQDPVTPMVAEQTQGGLYRISVNTSDKTEGFVLRDGNNGRMNLETKGGIDKWEATAGYYNQVTWKIEVANQFKVALNNAGDKSYATAYLPFGVSAVSGADAYVGTLNTDNTVLNMTQTTSVPAEKGFVLVGAKDATATLTIGTANEVNSDLTGTNTAITLTDDNRANYLVFGRKKDVTTNELGFFKTTAATIPANKAFLNASALTTQEAIAMNFGGNTTGVNTVVLGENGVNAPVFDLSGRRVVAPVKGGVYIQNGKKFIK